MFATVTESRPSEETIRSGRHWKGPPLRELFRSFDSATRPLASAVAVNVPSVQGKVTVALRPAARLPIENVPAGPTSTTNPPADPLPMFATVTRSEEMLRTTRSGSAGGGVVCVGLGVTVGLGLGDSDGDGDGDGL
jgi:hypothetical protein